MSLKTLKLNIMIQSLLNVAGSSLDVDGVVGVNTIIAINEFKANKGLVDFNLITLKLIDRLHYESNRIASELFITQDNFNSANEIVTVDRIIKGLKSINRNPSNILFTKTKGVPVITIEELALHIEGGLNTYFNDSLLVLSHMLTQFSHESDGLRSVEEYKNRDGSIPHYWKNYKGGADNHGRGLIQTTHDVNYARYFQHVGMPSNSNKNLLKTDVTHIVKSSLYFWRHGSAWGNLNKAALADDPILICMGVNGGFNGLKDRLSTLNKIKTALNIDVHTTYRLAQSRIAQSNRQAPRFIGLFGNTIRVK